MVRDEGFQREQGASFRIGMEAFSVLSARTADSTAATLVGCLVVPFDQLGAEGLADLEALDVLEVRADLVGDLDAALLRERFSGKLLYTLRSVDEWGQFEGGATDRGARLREAAQTYDFVDLEVARDLSPETLDVVSPAQRVLSWHGSWSSDLHALLAEMDVHDAAVRKLVTLAERNGQEVPTLEFLLDCGRSDVVAFSAGACGVWTRLMAPRVGCPWVYAAIEGSAAPGQLTLRRLVRDFGLPELRPVEQVYGILGRPVEHSLSPRLHNGGYRDEGVAALYLPLHAERFADFWMDTLESGIFDRLGAPLCGLSVTTPYKEPALAVAGASSPRAATLRAGNTLLLRDGVWECVSTDPEGVVAPLQRLGAELEDMPVAVVGCGGAGRAAALGLREAGAQVTLFNRSEDKGREAAARIGVDFLPLSAIQPRDYGVMVQATALGSDPDDPMPWDATKMSPEAILVEMVYRSGATPLERVARERGLKTVSGREVLLFQGIEQYRLMVGGALRPELGMELLSLEEST